MDSGTPKSRLASSAFVLGIIACSLNVLLITVPLGLLFGFLAVIFAGITLMKDKQGWGGMVLGLFSLLILVIYMMTLVLPAVLDPTWQFELFND